MEGALCIFQSAILQTEIQFKRAKNDAKTAIFVIRKGDDHYRCILFDDGTETGPYQRMYKMREKLKKGKVITVEAEMTLYERPMIPDNVWSKIVENNDNSKYPEGINPTKAKFPQFKVRDWDYSIPIEYYEKDKEKKKKETNKTSSASEIPYNLTNFQNGGAI